jgi:hypothetical protein
VAGLERANTAMHLAGSLIESNPEQARTLLADAGADYEQANVQPPAELNRALRRLGGERKALARGDASELRFERLRPLFVRPLGLLDPLGLLEWLRSS